MRRNVGIRLGVFLIIIGYGSAVLHAATDLQFTIIAWADGMQPAAGIVVGTAGLLLLLLPFVLRARQQQSVKPAGYPAAPPMYPAQGVGQPPPGYGPPQQQYGQPPQFGQQQYGQQQYGQPPQFGQQQFGQHPPVGQELPYGQPQFDQRPQFGQQPPVAQPPQYGQPPAAPRPPEGGQGW